MNEQIEIKKQLDGLRERVKFLKDWQKRLIDWVALFQVNVKDLDLGDISTIKTIQQYYEIKDKIYQLQNEANHKEYLIKMREHDQKMFEQQREAIVKKVNSEMGGLIKGLRTKIFPDIKHSKIADSIIKSFSKNSYENMEQKIADFRMAEQLLK